MKDLSVIIVAENAEEIIHDCLESAKWAGEIVVADVNSSDRTVELASEYTVKIIKLKQRSSSGERWNRAIEAASKDWVFLLESDKRISAELKEELFALQQADRLREADAYFAPTRNYFLCHWLKTKAVYPDYKLYLFRRGVAHFESRHQGGIVFEGKSRYLAGNVEHLVYRTLEQAISKINRNSDGLAKELYAQRTAFKKRYLLTKPLRLFKKQYFRQGGNKAGLTGLVFCLLSAFERFLIYAKRWEIEIKKA